MERKVSSRPPDFVDNGTKIKHAAGVPGTTRRDRHTVPAYPIRLYSFSRLQPVTFLEAAGIKAGEHKTHNENGVAPRKRKKPTVEEMEATWQGISPGIALARHAVLNIILRNGYSQADVNDVIQDGIEIMLRRGLEGVEKPVTYFFVTCIKRAVYLTRRSNRVAPVDPLIELSDNPAHETDSKEVRIFASIVSDEPDPQVYVTDKDEEKRLFDEERRLIDEMHVLIRSLPVKQRKLINGILEELTYREMSVLYGIPMGSVGPTVKRAKDKLRQRLVASM